jgi:hypothetical protein
MGEGSPDADHPRVSWGGTPEFRGGVPPSFVDPRPSKLFVFFLLV